MKENTRKVVIVTDGDSVQIEVNETAGVLELRAILTTLLTYLNK